MGTWTVFNGLGNAGNAGADFGTYDKMATSFSAAVSGVAYGTSMDNVSSPGTATLGVARSDSNLVFAISSTDVTDADGTRSSVFTTGTNENAATGSNNLPWIITCDDANVKGQTDHPLVADCDYSQGPQLGVK